jgi:two-component system, OmpR family, response regulator
MQISKVMVVDDDASIRRIAEISLTKVGHWNVMLLTNGKEALENVSDFKPDVVVMDFMMPGMDGATLYNEMRKLTDTPIIFMTAKVHKHEVDAYFKIGADGVISKPFDPMKLPEQIKSICEKTVQAVCQF